MDDIWVRVTFDAMIRLSDFNVGGVGGFEFTNATATVRGERIIDIVEGGGVKNRLEGILRANGVDFIEVRIISAI